MTEVRYAWSGDAEPHVIARRIVDQRSALNHEISEMLRSGKYELGLMVGILDDEDLERLPTGMRDDLGRTSKANKQIATDCRRLGEIVVDEPPAHVTAVFGPPPAPPIVRGNPNSFADNPDLFLTPNPLTHMLGSQREVWLDNAGRLTALLLVGGVDLTDASARSSDPSINGLLDALLIELNEDSLQNPMLSERPGSPTDPDDFFGNQGI